jgi:hypothetical protein
MPRTAETARGGVIRYRTIRRGGRTIRIAVVRKAGPRGGHTIGKPIPKG